MKNRRLFVFDMDGTLLDENGIILPENVTAIMKLQSRGHLLAIASGRGRNAIGKFIDKFFEENPFTYYLGHNGVYTYNVNTRQIKIHSSIKTDVAINIIALVEKFSFNALVSIYSEEDGIIHFMDNGLKDFVSQKSNMSGTDNFSDLYDFIKSSTKIIQIGIIIDPKNNLHTFNILSKNFGSATEVTRPGDIFVDLNPVGINKYAAISKVIELENMPERSVISFGDSGNDIEMIRQSNIGIVMENGDDNVKKYATEVIGNNNKPSIANWLVKEFNL